MVTSTIGGLIAMINVCEEPTQPSRLGTTLIEPPETTVVEIASVPKPIALLPEIFAEPVAELMVHKFGTAHA